MFIQTIIKFKMFKIVFEKSRGHMPPPSCGRQAVEISKCQLIIFVYLGPLLPWIHIGTAYNIILWNVSSIIIVVVGQTSEKFYLITQKSELHSPYLKFYVHSYNRWWTNINVLLASGVETGSEYQIKNITSVIIKY